MSVRPTVGKTQVEREKGAAFLLTNRCDVVVICATKLLIVNRDGIVTGFVQQVGKLDGKILIDLELHALGHRDNTLTRQLGGIRDRRLYGFLR